MGVFNDTLILGTKHIDVQCSCLLYVTATYNHMTFVLQTEQLLDLCEGGCKAELGQFEELLKNGADPNAYDSHVRYII